MQWTMPQKQNVWPLSLTPSTKLAQDHWGLAGVSVNEISALTFSEKINSGASQINVGFAAPVGARWLSQDAIDHAQSSRTCEGMRAGAGNLNKPISGVSA
jgi:hypothetical protein